MAYIGKVTDTAGNTHLVGSMLYGTCATAAATAAKVVTCANFSKLETGVTIHVKFTYTNSASSPTLNVNSTGAKPILGTTGVISGVSKWSAGAVVSFTYDGQYWCMNDVYFVDTDTKNTAGSNQDTAKLYLVGAKSQTTGSNGVQTYSSSKVYETDGALVADSFNGVSVGVQPIVGHLVISSGTKSLTVNGTYTLDDACEKGVDTSITSGTTSTDLPTSQAVADYVDSAVAIASSGALTYKGTATALTDITNTSYKQGWYWMVGSNPSITIDGQACEAGDMIIAKQDKTATADNDLDVIQANIETLTNGEIDTLWAAA